MHGRISSIHTVASFLNRRHYKKYVGHLGVVPHLEWILTERRNILETDPGVKAAVIHPVVAVVFADIERCAVLFIDVTCIWLSWAPAGPDGWLMRMHPIPITLLFYIHESKVPVPDTCQLELKVCHTGKELHFSLGLGFSQVASQQFTLVLGIK